MSLCRVHCSMEALRHNWELLSASGKPLMPVVKADAYGHGVVSVARELASLGAQFMAVGTVDEGLLLRQSGFLGVIVALLGASVADDVLKARRHAIVPLVHDWRSLELLENGLGGGPLPVALKCDSGMGRLGFLPEDMAHVAARMRDTGILRPDFLLSHLATADMPEEDDYTFDQARRFQAALRAVRALFPGVRCSLGNSAALLAFPEMAGDVARPGVALYGGNPFFGTSRAILGAGLEPVMEVRVPVLSVHDLCAGESLGYGRLFRASSPRRVAWVGVGYADGFRRNPAPEACMTLHGARVPLIGRVAMQMTCLDVTEAPQPVKPGDEAFILGGEGQAVTPHELALWWGTISYEVMCLLGKNSHV